MDLYLDCKGGYMHVYVFQDSLNCACKVDALGEKGEHMLKRMSSVCGQRGGSRQPGGLGDPWRWDIA